MDEYYDINSLKSFPSKLLNSITITSTSSKSTKTYFPYTNISYGGKYFSYSVYCDEDYEEGLKLRKRIRLKENFVETTHLKEIVEERIEQFVYDNVDRDFIIDAGGNIDSWITEKGYDICEKVIQQALNHEFDDDFDSEIDEDELTEILFNGINFDTIYEIIDDIINTPITFEEKLADVGMSIHDFI